MDEWRERTNREDGRPGWLGFAKGFWIALLVLGIFMLGHVMVAHHFFSGGAQNNRSTGGPTGP